jgi:hypothetical protein
VYRRRVAGHEEVSVLGLYFRRCLRRLGAMGRLSRRRDGASVRR